MLILGFPIQIYFFALPILGLVAFFISSFLLQSIRLKKIYDEVLVELKELKGKTVEAGIFNYEHYSELKKVLQIDPIFSRLWEEYDESLHKQMEIDPLNGNERLSKIRATVSSSAFFSQEVLIESPLKTEFFKHVPGILTGIGIIGTFYGILIGLIGFEISANSEVVKKSLQNLLGGVSEAFLVSLTAISFAMLITFIEKIYISILGQKVEKIHQTLDGFFEAGAGEEYLARLVKSSEGSFSQLAILKDSLVSDLTQILTDLANRQINAGLESNNLIRDKLKVLDSTEHFKKLNEKLESVINQGVTIPVNQLSDKLGNFTKDAGDTSQRMLMDVLTNFSQQMKELFGDQISGINELQQQTIDVMTNAVKKLEEMVTNVQNAGTQGTESMAEKLNEAMVAAEARQEVMNQKMTEFLGHINKTLNDSQSEIQKKIQESLNEIADSMKLLIEKLTGIVQDTSKQNNDNNEAFKVSTTEAVGNINEQVNTVVEGVNKAVDEMRIAVNIMKDVTTDSISKMSTGADTLYVAATDFAKAGKGVSDTMSKSTELAEQLKQASASVSSASSSLTNVVSDYKNSRDSVTQLVSSLNSIIENAKKDASLTSDILRSIETSTNKLIEAQKQADSYLDDVSSVIETSHEAFSQGMVKAVGEANRDFHSALSSSVKLLRETIGELEATFDTITNRK